jgi:hypothetical protein
LRCSLKRLPALRLCVTVWRRCGAESGDKHELALMRSSNWFLVAPVTPAQNKAPREIGLPWGTGTAEKYPEGNDVAGTAVDYPRSPISICTITNIRGWTCHCCGASWRGAGGIAWDRFHPLLDAVQRMQCGTTIIVAYPVPGALYQACTAGVLSTDD